MALPAGLPLGWVAKLPLRTRTRSLVSRLRAEHGDGALDSALLVEDIMAMRHVGTTTLIDLLCVLESAELDIGLNRASDPYGRPVIIEARTTREQRRIHGIAAWARSETDAVTLGDAFTLLVGGETGPKEWRDLAEVRLSEIAQPPPHPYRLVEAWVARLPEREQQIFILRMGAIEERSTLEDIGSGLGITRERVRQIAKQLYAELLSYVETRAGYPIRWRIDTIRREFGVAIPQDRTVLLLDTPKGCPDYSSLLLEIAGPYVASDGWLVHRSALPREPTSSILALADPFGRIDRQRATNLLDGWGLRQSLHSEWLTRDGRVRLIDGRLIRWKGPLADKLAFALDEMGHPSTPQALLDHLGLNQSIGYTKNVLAADHRFTRVSLRDYGLAAWGLSEYTGIASSIRTLIEREGPMPVDEVVGRLHAAFGTRKATARSYCEAPAFVVEKGLIRLRRDDEPYIYGQSSIRSVRGVFALGDGRVGLLFRVDVDVLRGSGRSLAAGAGRILGVAPNDSLVLRSADGASLSVSFRDTSITGPALGSMRSLVSSDGAEEGDYMNLVLDRREGSVSVAVTRQAETGGGKPGWPLVARLTGIDPATGIQGLATALQCSPEEAEEVLRRRGDGVVADVLPIRVGRTDIPHPPAASGG